MVFNSLSYLLFLLIAIPLSYRLAGRIRLWMLFVFSLVFYGLWRWDFTLLMLFSAWIDYVASLKIEKSTEAFRRKAWLCLSLVMNLGLLVAFKYAYFIDDNIQGVASFFGSGYTGLRSLPFSIILPLGISFYTFQTISYTIDVYRRVQEPTRDFILFGTYVTFWPQLVAGPILRGQEVIPQLMERKTFAWNNLSDGMFLVLVGLFKKVVLADNIAALVNEGFLLDPNTLAAWDTWTLAILFGFQIYFDFSGYSDIAIGTARMMGFHFPENFDWPYLSRSPREFWRKWHISLSSWIRDYLYLPLMGVRFRGSSQGGMEPQTNETVSGRRAYTSLFVTWIIMGFWHGAGWNFGIWGFYHAMMIFLFRRIKALERFASALPILSMPVTFFLMMASWIPFRSQSVRQTLSMFATLVMPSRYSLSARQLHISYYFYATMIIAGMVVMYRIYQLKLSTTGSFVMKALAVPLMVFFIIVYLSQEVQFIYFQF